MKKNLFVLITFLGFLLSSFFSSYAVTQTPTVENLPVDETLFTNVERLMKPYCDTRSVAGKRGLDMAMTVLFRGLPPFQARASFAGNHLRAAGLFMQAELCAELGPLHTQVPQAGPECKGDYVLNQLFSKYVTASVLWNSQARPQGDSPATILEEQQNQLNCITTGQRQKLAAGIVKAFDKTDKQLIAYGFGSLKEKFAQMIFNPLVLISETNNYLANWFKENKGALQRGMTQNTLSTLVLYDYLKGSMIRIPFMPSTDPLYHDGALDPQAFLNTLEDARGHGPCPLIGFNARTPGRNARGERTYEPCPEICNELQNHSLRSGFGNDTGGSAAVHGVGSSASASGRAGSFGGGMSSEGGGGGALSAEETARLGGNRCQDGSDLSYFGLSSTGIGNACGENQNQRQHANRYADLEAFADIAQSPVLQIAHNPLCGIGDTAAEGGKPPEKAPAPKKEPTAPAPAPKEPKKADSKTSSPAPAKSADAKKGESKTPAPKVETLTPLPDKDPTLGKPEDPGGKPRWPGEPGKIGEVSPDIPGYPALASPRDEAAAKDCADPGSCDNGCSDAENMLGKVEKAWAKYFKGKTTNQGRSVFRTPPAAGETHRPMGTQEYRDEASTSNGPRPCGSGRTTPGGYGSGGGVCGLEHCAQIGLGQQCCQGVENHMVLRSFTDPMCQRMFCAEGQTCACAGERERRPSVGPVNPLTQQPASSIHQQLQQGMPSQRPTGIQQLPANTTNTQRSTPTTEQPAANPGALQNLQQAPASQNTRNTMPAAATRNSSTTGSSTTLQRSNTGTTGGNLQQAPANNSQQTGVREMMQQMGAQPR